MVAVNGVFVWSSVPFIMVTLLGGLQAIPSELVEAAVVDGATFGQRFRMVVLPLMLPIITIATILRVIYTIQNFVIVYMLTQGGPATPPRRWPCTCTRPRSTRRGSARPRRSA